MNRDRRDRVVAVDSFRALMNTGVGLTGSFFQTAQTAKRFSLVTPDPAPPIEVVIRAHATTVGRIELFEGSTITVAGNVVSLLALDRRVTRPAGLLVFREGPTVTVNGTLLAVRPYGPSLTAEIPAVLRPNTNYSLLMTNASGDVTCWLEVDERPR